MTAPAIPKVRAGDMLHNWELLHQIGCPRRKVSLTPVDKPHHMFNDDVIQAQDFRKLYPKFAFMADCVESEDFQYLMIEIGGFVLKVMRWI